MFGLKREELYLLKNLSNPQKIQDFLDALPINHEKEGETCYSVRMTLRERKAHCLEGALLGACALLLQGQKPLLLDFKTLDMDECHAVALFRQNGYWGALSKTNHAVLRYRDPVYRNLRELALSYFHEYFMTKTGRKTLRSYSLPFSLKPLGLNWISGEEHLLDLSDKLDRHPHFALVPKRQEKLLRPVSAHERKLAYLEEWSRKDSRT